jgi:hypothetical protein
MATSIVISHKTSPNGQDTTYLSNDVQTPRENDSKIKRIFRVVER